MAGFYRFSGGEVRQAASAEDDDVAPELYLISAPLYDMSLYKEVLIPLQGILKKQPGNSEARTLAEHMTKLMRRRRPVPAE